MTSIGPEGIGGEGAARAQHDCVSDRHDGLKRLDGDGKVDPTLPDLVINEADPTATAKELASLIAKGDDFLFNGYVPVRVAVETDSMPRAIEVTAEAVRVQAHEICRPVKKRHHRGLIELQPVPLSRDIAQLYLNGLEGQWGLQNLQRHYDGAHLERRRQHPV